MTLSVVGIDFDHVPDLLTRIVDNLATSLDATVTAESVRR